WPQARLQSQELGQDLRGVDELLQLHALVEADVAAQAERVKALGAAAHRFSTPGEGYQPCDPSAVRTRVATLELQYQELVALAGRRRRQLEESRVFWKFFWDTGEEETWLREQQKLLVLSSPDLGRDLSSCLQLLHRHDAFRGELRAREGPLGQALAKGRDLVAKERVGASAVLKRLREVEERWRTLVDLANERERRLREATRFFQLQADMVDAEGWVEDALRLAKSQELGHDEFSTRSFLRQHREVREDVQSHRVAMEALGEQVRGLPPGFGDHQEVSRRLEELRGRYREVEEEVERRKVELEATLRFFTARSQAQACGGWLGEKEKWLHQLEVPQQLEDLEVVQQRFETLEQEVPTVASRVASVNGAVEQLLATDQRHREDLEETRRQLNHSWSRFLALAEQKKATVTSALSLQNFHLECDETRAWMLEKTQLIESTQPSASDASGVLALQQKLQGVQRDLDAIQAKVRDLREEAQTLVATQPQQEGAILARLGTIQEVLEELTRSLRGREEALGEATKLQSFLRDLGAFQGWLSSTRTSVASQEVPATLEEAERSLGHHESLRQEMTHYGEDYRRVELLGQEVTRGQPPQQKVLLQRRLETLAKGWQELGGLWERRHRLLSRAFALQLFLRDVQQVEGVLSGQEFCLAQAEVSGAEGAVKKQEELVATMEATGERLQGVVAAGRKLVAEGGGHVQKVQELVETLERRWGRGLLSLWIEEKTLVAQDGASPELRDLPTKWQKHQTFAAEVAANKGWLEKVEKEGHQLASAKVDLAPVVLETLERLRGRWEELEKSSRSKERRLFTAHQVQGWGRSCAALR
ncbi:SPTN2 protein, partial [Brachypteracias leptosomus]|nr:SPTN2 protein [Brachypteracias leptosomus]